MNWHDWFYYDETSPSCLRWKVDRWVGRWYKVKLFSAGDVAGSQRQDGYWVASWTENRGKIQKCFSALKLGFEAAKAAAIACRRNAVQGLEGYSERHGK